jgi:hypothetical protein
VLRHTDQRVSELREAVPRARMADAAASILSADDENTRTTRNASTADGHNIDSVARPQRAGAEVAPAARPWHEAIM